jgi:phosphohistidine swiveling domain-containing protein
MSNKKIKDKIIERVKLFQLLGGNYLYTEFFFLNKVEKLIIKYPLKYKEMHRNYKEIGELKFKAREVLNDFYNYKKIFEPYIKEISKRTKRKNMQWLSYQETIDILDGKKINVLGRGHTNWILTKINNWKLVNGERAKRIILEFDNYFFNKKVDIINGVSANPGKYQGQVRIVRTIFSSKIAEEIKKVRRGDVLVAETSGPEMMVACRRAGAIVTDEGGLLSHAATVSRELGVPCIVGAKIATKVLKDGDLVEVKADEGLVRKLINIE